MTSIILNQLNSLANQVKHRNLLELFATEDDRIAKFTKQIGGLTIDFSKQLISHEILQELISFAEEKNIQHQIAELNQTIDAQIKNYGQPEKAELAPECFSLLRRQVLGALMNPSPVDANTTRSVAIGSMFHIELANMVASLQHRMTNLSVINIGMGGSSLGPELLNQALLNDVTDDHSNTGATMVSISNLDDVYITNQIAGINHNNFVIVLQSKSFQTDEIFKLYQKVKRCLLDRAVQEHSIMANTYAVTAQPAQAREFGVPSARILVIPTWLSGRYSIWSNMCFPICLIKGMDTYYQLLKGADTMDKHFFSSPLADNFPVIGALIDFWNQQYLHINHRVVLPYSARLNLLISYLAQLETESLGKSIDSQGKSEKTTTGQFVWGALGTEYQHSIGQMLHQGTNTFQAEFIGILDASKELLVNLVAQSQTLMHGHDAEDSRKYIPGDRPSSCFLLTTLSAETLGSLLSYYEHKVYILSKLLDINAFDQWGVERAKEIAKVMHHKLENSNDYAELLDFASDPSTKFLLKKIASTE